MSSTEHNQSGIKRRLLSQNDVSENPTPGKVAGGRRLQASWTRRRAFRKSGRTGFEVVAGARNIVADRPQTSFTETGITWALCQSATRL